MALSDFLKTHFHSPEKLANKSNRSIYTCHHCSAKVQHRENALLEHLAYPTRCSKAPADVRAKAHRDMAVKGGATETTAPVVTAPVLAHSQVEGIEPGAVAERPVKKARLSQPGMKLFADTALTKDQKQSADLAFFRLVKLSLPEWCSFSLSAFLCTHRSHSELRTIHSLPSGCFSSDHPMISPAGSPFRLKPCLLKMSGSLRSKKLG